MATIDNVVNVNITAETNFITTRDLNTIAILSEHTRFAEVYRIYETASAMLTDGFVSGDFAYKAALKIFSQNPRAQKVVIGRKETADTYAIAIGKLVDAYNQFYHIHTDATTDAEILSAAEYVETIRKLHFYHTNDTDVLAATTTDIAAQLEALNYNRSVAFYNTDVANGVPTAALLGRFAPEPAGSVTWLYKTLVGVVADTFTATQEANLKAKNVNYYTTIEGVDVVFGNGVVASGEYIDVMIGIDWIHARIQERVFNTLLNNRKIGYTSDGVAKIETEVRAVLAEATDRGILANDTPYVIKVPNVLALTPAQRNTRQLPAITFRARLAGAIHMAEIVGSVYP
jgi:hypothetical protein